MTAWPELGFRVSIFPVRIVRISSFSSLDSSFESWVLVVSSSSASERLVAVSKRRSSRVWLRNDGDGGGGFVEW